MDADVLELTHRAPVRRRVRGTSPGHVVEHTRDAEAMIDEPAFLWSITHIMVPKLDATAGTDVVGRGIPALGGVIKWEATYRTVAGRWDLRPKN